jgi:hypothetical protein
LGRKRKVWFRARECCFGHSTHSTGFRGIVSGRGGVAFDRFLVYGTGDVAFGSNTLPNAAVAIVAGIPGFFTNTNSNSTRLGYAIGAGVEYAFLPTGPKVEHLFRISTATTRPTFCPERAPDSPWLVVSRTTLCALV